MRQEKFSAEKKKWNEMRETGAKNKRRKKKAEEKEKKQRKIKIKKEI